jgi:hypothetical protein
MFSFAKLIVPESNETKEVDVAQTWEVRWESRHGEYSGDTQPEMEVFTSREEAEAFAQSLRNAFQLIRHSSGTHVALRQRPLIR